MRGLGFNLIAWVAMLVSLGHLSENDSSNEVILHRLFHLSSRLVGTEEIPQDPTPPPKLPRLRSGPASNRVGCSSLAPAPTPAWKPNRQGRNLSRPGVPCRGSPGVVLPAPRVPKDTGPEGLLMSGDLKASPRMEDLQTRINATLQAAYCNWTSMRPSWVTLADFQTHDARWHGQMPWASKGLTLQVLSSGVSLRNLGLKSWMGARPADEKLVAESRTSGRNFLCLGWVIGETRSGGTGGIGAVRE